PVEAPYFVGAVVLAIAGTDAAVVDLTVEALAGVVRRKDRTYRLAGRVITLLAEHRRQVDTRPRFAGGGEVAFDANPGHDSPATNPFPPDDRHIVLGIAGRDARAASGAGINVDGHAPLTLVIEGRVHFVRLRCEWCFDDFATACQFLDGHGLDQRTSHQIALPKRSDQFARGCGRICLYRDVQRTRRDDFPRIRTAILCV